MIFAWFCAANICVYFQYLFMHCVCANIFGAIVLNLRFKIDVVVIVIWSNVIIINSVLTLQVLTASLPHDREPWKIKVVSNHTCSLHTCVCAGSRRVRIRLSGFRWQGISSTPGGLLKCPIPVRVCAEHIQLFLLFKVFKFLTSMLNFLLKSSPEAITPPQKCQTVLSWNFKKKEIMLHPYE
jgi:hypothetical protein